MKKRVLAVLLAGAMVATMFAGCGSSSSSDSAESDTAEGSVAAESEEAGSGETLNVGAILVGDETECYTLVHMQGMEAAVEALAEEGITVNLSYKKSIPESDEVTTNAKDLIADGNTLIVTNSYGHQYYLDEVIEAYPEVNFVAMTGDLAAVSGYDNYYNAFTDVYESRYVSGVVAGLKLQELIDAGSIPETGYDADGKIKIGYVGAFNYAEVVSGYTAFFLGIESVVGQDTVAMTVKYTNSWFSEEREAAVAEYLMDEGCVIIGQHADSTGAPAAVQARYDADNSFVCYSVGYNVDMTDVAPDVALTSPLNNWEVYYTTLFRAAATGSEIPQDWAEGYSEGAVSISPLGSAISSGANAVAEVEDALAAGETHVFDTSTFTVGGEEVTSYLANVIPDDNYEGDTEAISDGYFHESEYRSAPYFDLRIDGITELDSDYEAE